MNKFKTPNIDRSLLEDGFVRVNEALLWIKKRKDRKYPYKIVFDIGDALFSLEEVYNHKEADKEKLDKLVKEVANENICINYSTEKNLFEKLLILSSDFYYHRRAKKGENAEDMQKKYEEMFEKFTKN